MTSEPPLSQRNETHHDPQPPPHCPRHHRYRGAGRQHASAAGLGRRGSCQAHQDADRLRQERLHRRARPGKLFIGTIFKGEHFHVDRSARVKSGSAKGLWHHGTRIATGSKGTYKTTGWVKASAFCS
jgi:hypothetical protein